MKLWKSTGLGLGIAAGLNLVSASPDTHTIVLLFTLSVVCNFIGIRKGEK